MLFGRTMLIVEITVITTQYMENKMRTIEQDEVFSPQYVVKDHVVHVTAAVKEDKDSPLRHEIGFSIDFEKTPRSQLLAIAARQLTVQVQSKFRKVGPSKFKMIEKTWTPGEIIKAETKSKEEKLLDEINHMPVEKREAFLKLAKSL